MRSSPLIAAAALASVLSTGVAAQPSPDQPAPAPPNAPRPSGPSPAAPQSTGTPQPTAEPTEAQREAAREAYARGQALFTENRHAEAKAAFEQAYAQVPNPVVLLSIAECDVRLGNLEQAHETFQRYLSERPDAPDRAEVQQKMAELEATPATLVLTTEPAGALIILDGTNTGKTTPAEITVPRGEHRVELALDGHQPATTSVTARIGARHELHSALEPEPPPLVAPAEPVGVQTADQGSPTTALWITGVLGTAGVVTGTVLGFMVLAEQSDFDSNPTVESADRGERLALFTDVAFGVGAMALITGAVIYLTAGEADGDASGEREAAHLRLAPTFSPDSAGVVARTRF